MTGRFEEVTGIQACIILNSTYRTGIIAVCLPGFCCVGVVTVSCGVTGSVDSELENLTESCVCIAVVITVYRCTCIVNEEFYRVIFPRILGSGSIGSNNVGVVNFIESIEIIAMPYYPTFSHKTCVKFAGLEMVNGEV